MIKKAIIASALTALLLCGCGQEEKKTDNKNTPPTFKFVTPTNAAGQIKPSTTAPTTEPPTEPTVPVDMSTWESAYTCFLLNKDYRCEKYEDCDWASAALVYLTDDDIPELVVKHTHAIEEIYTYDRETHVIYPIFRSEPLYWGEIGFLPYRSAFEVKPSKGCFLCYEVNLDIDEPISDRTLFPLMGTCSIPYEYTQPEDYKYERYSILKDTSVPEGSTYASDWPSDEWVLSDDVPFYKICEHNASQRDLMKMLKRLAIG